MAMQAKFLFFSWQIKISNILHVGLILIIGKVFTILWSTLPGIREYPGNFQNETEQEVAYPLEKQEFTPKNKTKKKFYF